MKHFYSEVAGVIFAYGDVKDDSLLDFVRSISKGMMERRIPISPKAPSPPVSSLGAGVQRALERAAGKVPQGQHACHLRRRKVGQVGRMAPSLLRLKDLGLGWFSAEAEEAVHVRVLDGLDGSKFAKFWIRKDGVILTHNKAASARLSWGRLTGPYPPIAILSS